MRALQRLVKALVNEPCAHSLKVALTDCEAGTHIKRSAGKNLHGRQNVMPGGKGGSY